MFFSLLWCINEPYIRKDLLYVDKCNSRLATIRLPQRNVNAYRDWCFLSATHKHKLHFPSLIKFSSYSTMNIYSTRALDIGCFDWQIWQANDNTQALWLLYRYISKAKITVLIIFVMAFTLTVETEWIPLVGWKLKDASLCQRCNFLPFFISSHLRVAQFKLSEKNSKFWIQSLSHFQWFH